MENKYNLQIQQLYTQFNALSKEYSKTPHEIWYDIQSYHSMVRNGVIKTTQTRIDFFTNLKLRALEFSSDDKNE